MGGRGPRYVFGYGSLVNRLSLARALGREPGADDLRPAWLDGWARIWSVAEWVAAAARDHAHVHARFLDVAPRPGARVNGVLVPVDDALLARFDLREKVYARVAVTHAVTGAEGAAEVYVYSSGRAPEGEVVLADYIRLVEAGFAALGPGQLEAYRASTDAPGVPLLEGDYRFVDAAQNALTSRGAGRS